MTGNQKRMPAELKMLKVKDNFNKRLYSNKKGGEKNTKENTKQTPTRGPTERKKDKIIKKPILEYQ